MSTPRSPAGGGNIGCRGGGTGRRVATPRRVFRFGDGLLEGPPDRPGLVLGLLELELGHRLRDDAGADGAMDQVVLDHRGTDGDGGVQVAVVAEITHRPAVQATPLAFVFGDELHRPNLRRARKGPGREDAAERVQGVALGLEPRLDVAHQMEDVAVALDLHVLGHGHGSGSGDAAQIVAAQVDEHHVLGALLGIALRAVGELGVLGRGGAARPGPGDRVSRHAVALDANEQLGAGADDGELRHPDEEQVGLGLMRRSER